MAGRVMMGVLHRIGRRGASLLFVALLNFVYAVSLLTIPPESRGSPGIAFLELLLPLPMWAAIWGTVGLTCMVQALMLTDRLAFAAASLLMVVWGTVYLLGWAVGEIPRGFVSAVIWLGFAGWLAIISGWREARRDP
ncbi:hypothetical protein [Planotetraspora kaengkrachanensis]|uniref:Uncharacterized protein n=1 Tax=Planotetraspora kaengkrachanensis TaxID=575193 RepID=A0A8J3PUQ5_9ACTN|nr:hypothetical protein [Planotetraspora kaengkrachanensis]GIG81436.1 hypothetical protein Pka01_45630 [Planotetraspora kaengkrachanensis]